MSLVKPGIYRGVNRVKQAIQTHLTVGLAQQWLETHKSHNPILKVNLTHLVIISLIVTNGKKTFAKEILFQQNTTQTHDHFTYLLIWGR